MPVLMADPEEREFGSYAKIAQFSKREGRPPHTNTVVEELLLQKENLDQDQDQHFGCFFLYSQKVKE